MQLFAKFKKILRRGFRATLNSQNFKAALNPLRRNFAKSCILSCWLQFDNKKWGSPSYKCLKLKLRVLLTGKGHIVAMVTYCATKLTATCSPMNRMVIMTHQTLSLEKYWKLLPATLNLHFRVNSLFHYLCSQCYAAQHSYVPLLSLRRDSPSKIVPDVLCATLQLSRQSNTVDLIQRSWVRFASRSKYFFFASCGSLFPFTRANAQWVTHGFK